MPVTAGTAYQIAVDGAAVQDAADDGTVVLSINQVPAIFSSAGASGTVGAAFAYTIQASNNPTGFDATNLPAGLSINPYTGAISGAPLTAGMFTVPISATNSAGTGTGMLTIIATATPPALTPTLTASGAVGSAFGYAVGQYADSIFNYYPFTSVIRETTTYAVTGLAPGLSLNPATGIITGTPTQPVSATNAVGTSNATLTFVMAAAPLTPVISSAAGAVATAGTAFGYSIYITSNANTPAASSYGADNLPAVLTLDPGTGRITGTPTAAGDSTIPISAASVGTTGRATLTLTVLPAPSNLPPTVPGAPVFTGLTGTIGFTANPFVHMLGAGGFAPDGSCPMG